MGMDGVQDWMDYDDNEDEDDDDYNMDQYWDISHKANQIYMICFSIFVLVTILKCAKMYHSFNYFEMKINNQ